MCNRLAQEKELQQFQMQRVGLIYPLFRATAPVYLPTIMSSRSVACGLMRVQMSMVKRVLLLLKMEAKEDMRAASITASIRPRKPAQTDSREEGGGTAGGKRVERVGGWEGMRGVR